MKKTYRGSCHCGEVKFEADIDLSAGTSKCNCTLCWKRRWWSVRVEVADFRALTGEAHLSDGADGGFCQVCGIRAYGVYNTDDWGVEWISGVHVSMNVACLDIDIEELLAAPIRIHDGLNDDWMTTPSETRHL